MRFQVSSSSSSSLIFIFEEASPLLITIITKAKHLGSRVGSLFAPTVGTFVCYSQDEVTEGGDELD